MVSTIYKASIGRWGVSADHPLAVLAGIEVLEKGGNAFDAAVAVSSVLSVVHPFSGGPGGDGFFMAFVGDDVIAYNGSGKSPSGFDPDAYTRTRPSRGPLTVTVPGLVEVWGYLAEKYCTMDLKDLLRPAIKLAESGYYADKLLAQAVRENYEELKGYECWVKLFGWIEEGSFVKNPDMAWALDRIARKGWHEFYEGELSERFVEDLRRMGVNIDHDDLRSHRGHEVRPLSLDLGDSILYELPPNTQGISSLQMISTIYELDLKRFSFNDPKRIATWSEPVELIYNFRDKYIGDPAYMSIDPSKYTSYKSIELLMKNIWNHENPNNFAANVNKEPGKTGGDTTFFVAADNKGNAVGFIQSLYLWFGSGLISLGIPFQNRGKGFSHSKGLPNSPAPRKRPLHTLSMLLVEDFSRSRRYIIGCASGDHRPQIHTRIYENIFIYNMDLESAIEAPRFIYISPRKPQKVLVEGLLTPPEEIDKLGVIRGKLYDATGRVNAYMHDIKKGYSVFSPDPRSPSIAIAKG